MEEISISAEKIIEVFGFPLTNTLLMSLIVSFFIFLSFYISFKKRKILPEKEQNFFEWIVESLLSYIDKITGDREKTEEIFPLASTLFIFILFSNLLELIPGIGIFPFLRSPSSDFNFTLALATSSMIYVHLLAIKRLGFFKHFGKFLNFKNPILFFVSILEGTAELTRTFSLAMRLFGNLFAGEVLLIVTSYLLPYLFPLPFLFLEILVAFVQALIFSSLIVIFYSTAVEIH